MSVHPNSFGREDSNLISTYLKMNAACSLCLELFTSRCDISTTPCGHVFHTECISKWLENRQKNCVQCRKSCSKDQIIKLYFSEADQENHLIAELMEEMSLRSTFKIDNNF